jgi:CHAT domain-containing protein/Flp pilus assembly protein TadD
LGTIELRQNKQQVSGTYSERGGGTIEGVVQGSRLDFTWKDSNGSGWGFFRAIANGTILAGMWGSGTEKADGNSLIATQINQTAQNSKLPPTNNKQADRDLISTRNYKKGDSVEVLWDNTWWPAKVLEIKGEKYCITYEGWDSSWDECVDSNRIRPVAETAEAEAERLYRVGFNYLINKKYIEAVENLEKSLALCENKKLDNLIIRERALNAISVAYAILGDYEKLKKYAEKHLEIANQLYDPSAATIALVRIAGFYFDQGDYKTAELKLLEAVSRSKNIAPNTGGAALSALGQTYLAMGKIKEAIAYLEEALKIEDPEVRSSTLEGLGQAYIVQGNYKKAISFLEENRMIAKKYQGLFDVSIEANALNNLGYAFFKAGDLSKAEDSLRKAVVLWESQRNMLVSNNLYSDPLENRPLKVDLFKVSIFELQALSYGTLQKVLFLQGKPENALEVAEQGRSRAFADLLAQRLSPQAVEQITSKAPNIKQIREIAKIQNATLVEYSLIDSSPGFATPGKIQAKELLVWVIQPTGEVALCRVDLKDLQQQNTSFADLVYDTKKSILTEQFNPGNDSSPQLKQLHQLLIEPIARLLPKDSNARVIIIPHRELFLVPFSALLDADGKYFIEKHTISIAPSIQILDSTHQLAIQNRGLAKDNLIVGNPTFKKESEQPLQQLPNEEIQAQEIATLFNTKAIVRDRATKANIVQQMPKARIIHLGTHAKADDKEGLKSWIALASSANDDGFLTAEEIFRLFRLPQGLPLHAELVVLSACQTAQGKNTGDGVIGLSRSLIAAGVPSAIISLWSVEGNSSIDLIKAFYKNFQQNPDKAQALSNAMRSTMKKYPQPGDWAVFTLIGEAQ